MDIDFELVELRSFITLAERGSIAQAADALGTSRARVRRHVEQLEQSLGVQLFSKTRDGALLTAPGEEFLERARALLADARSLASQTRENSAEPHGRVRLGLQVGYPPAVALAVNHVIASKFPSAQAENVIAERPADLLPDKVDVALCVGEQTPKVPCVELVIGELEHRLYASRSFLASLGAPESIDAVEERLLGTWRGPDDDGQRLHFRNGRARPVRSPMITSDEQYLKLAALRNDGYVYAPLPMIPLDPDSSALCPVLEDTVGRTLRVRILVPEALANVPRIKLLLDTARSFMAQAL